MLALVSAHRCSDESGHAIGEPITKPIDAGDWGKVWMERFWSMPGVLREVSRASE
jgi:hypothetical protein